MPLRRSATAWFLYLQQRSAADGGRAGWVQDGSELWLLHYDGEKAGFSPGHAMTWDGTTPYPEP